MDYSKISKEEIMSWEQENNFNIPLMDRIFVIPQRKLHYSGNGFRTMVIAGYSKECNYKKILGTFTDLIDFKSSVKGGVDFPLCLDISSKGVITLFNRSGKILVETFGLSSLTIKGVFSDDR